MNGALSRRGRLAAAAVLGAALVIPVMPAHAAPQECNVKTGVRDTGEIPWAQRRLGFDRAWTITQGAGVTVAVIDSGINTDQAQMKLIHYVSPSRIIPGGAGPADTRDCVGHGTGVAGVIAAPKVLNVAFTGVAPQASIMPIKVTDQDPKNIPPDFIAEGIERAVARGAKVINISLTSNVDVPALRAAVQHAEAAGVVIVAAGNEGDDASRTAYPAAYPTVLAVAATDEQDNPASFSSTGSYIDIAAPGAGVETPAPIDGYTKQDGTSFATPYVSGTVALVLAAHPNLKPAQVRARLENTADPPPGVTVPSKRYGYGIVNPDLAVTAVRDDAVTTAPAAPQQQIPPPAPRVRTDRHLQHLALGVGVALIGLAILAWLGAAVIRRGAWLVRASVHPEQVIRPQTSRTQTSEDVVTR